MGGRQKKLTQARRKELTKEMTAALIAGRFTTNGRSLDEILDEVDAGIRNDFYPIDVTFDGLVEIWQLSGNPIDNAPAEAQTAAGVEQGAAPAADTSVSEQEAQVIHANLDAAQRVTDAGGTQMDVMQAAMGPAAVPGTVEHAQAQAAAANGASPTAQAILGTGPAIGTGNAIQGGHPAYSSAQQATVMLNPDGSAQHPLPGPAAAPGPAPVTEVGTPPAAPAPAEEKAPVVDVDLDTVRDWLAVARNADKKIKAAKDIMDQAMSQVNDFLDQQGGPDKSKKGVIDGQPAVRRTFVRRKNLNTDALLADHPEISREQYTERSPYYKSELL